MKKPESMAQKKTSRHTVKNAIKESEVPVPPKGLDKNLGVWNNRLLLATPSTGNVRMEWVMHRYGQIIPTNWSHVEMIEWINPYVPVQYLLPDAENLIAKQVVEGNYEWLLSIEEDNLLPQDAFIKINEYIQKAEVPIVSGLYFTKSHPAEPILYRGRGNGCFRDFKIGDKVWVDGVPFGFTLIHGSIIKAMWEESSEYVVNGQKTRRVFNMPDASFGNPEEGYSRVTGTTDLQWCTRIMKEKFFEKAGWPEYQKMKYPFLVDTTIMVGHIDRQGRQYPLGGIPPEFIRTEKKKTKNTKK